MVRNREALVRIVESENDARGLRLRRAGPMVTFFRLRGRGRWRANATDVDRLSDWLREHEELRPAALRVEMFKGRSNQTTNLLTPQRSCVMPPSQAN